MNCEQQFSRWLCAAFRHYGAIPVRLEVTTGKGVPDIALLYEGQTIWLELKWDTTFLRAEQYVWHLKAKEQNIRQYILSADENNMFLLNIARAVPYIKTKRYKLEELLATFPKTLGGVDRLLNYATNKPL